MVCFLLLNMMFLIIVWLLYDGMFCLFKVFISLFMFINMLFYVKNSFLYSVKCLKKVIFFKLW